MQLQVIICNFAAIVKNTTLHIRKKLHQLTALLLLVMFASIFTVQAVHEHHEEDCLTTTFEKEYNSPSEHCEICMFLAQHQHQDYLLPDQDTFVVPSLPAPEHISNVFIGNYKFTLQGFTNKGPPNAIS